MGKLLLLTLHLSLFKELWQIKQEHLILHSDLKEGDTGLPNHAERRPPLHVNSNNLSRLQQRQKLPAFADCPYLNIAGISLSNSQYPEYKCFLFNNCISLLVYTLQQSQVTFTAHLSYPLGASLLQHIPQSDKPLGLTAVLDFWREILDGSDPHTIPCTSLLWSFCSLILQIPELHSPAAPFPNTAASLPTFAGNEYLHVE